MSEIIHQHFMVDANCKNPIEDTDFIEGWLRELVDKIGMKILLEPRAAMVYDLNNWGPTGHVGITTSHASWHCWSRDKEPYFCFDLYSCKSFNEDVVLDHLSVFKPYNIRTQRVERGNPAVRSVLLIKRMTV